MTTNAQDLLRRAAMLDFPPVLTSRGVMPANAEAWASRLADMSPADVAAVAQRLAELEQDRARRAMRDADRRANLPQTPQSFRGDGANTRRVVGNDGWLRRVGGDD
jgi:hypothetical protein